MRTKEQQEYVEKLLGKKKIPKRSYLKRYKYEPPPPPKKTDYMRNCIFWIDEHIEGRTDLVMLRKSINALKAHIYDLEQKYFSLLNPT